MSRRRVKQRINIFQTIGLRGIIIIFLLFIVAIFEIYQWSLSSTVTSPTRSNISPDTIVARFADQTVTAKQIDDVELSFVQNLIKKGEYSDAIRKFVDDTTFYKIFDGIEIRRQLKLHSLQNISDLVSLIAPKKQVDNQMALSFYRDHPDLFARSKPRIHIREIVVKDENLAQELLNDIHSGKSFIKLAQQYSVDPSQYRNLGGDIGWIGKGGTLRDWDNMIFSLKPGAISNVLPFNSFYYIIQVIEGPTYDVVPYEDVSSQVPDLEAKYMQDQQFTSWLSTQILSEPCLIMRKEYSSAIEKALKDLQNNLTQEATFYSY